ncbi:MAG TPA: MFS transporter [Candidatus Hydrogenedentes bacterium]|nr:MFS transporter [Candidatus Hydrogenedentota bacterium]HNT88760.1 MFS transporter [Candidatus Hydrogenedentota bacterium]
MLRWMRPAETLSDSEVDRGLRMLLRDAMASQTMIVLTVGPFMMAFAVLLGASNVVLGLIGAIGPLSQILQLPAVFLVERVKLRKMLTLGAAFISRLAWIVIASMPLWTPPPYRIPVFMGSLLLFFGMNAVASCAFSSWTRDLIPDTVLNTFFGKRMMWATIFGATVSLIGAFGIDALGDALESQLHAYGVVFSIGALAGFVGLFFLGHVPEPRMHRPTEHHAIKVLSEPLRDANFRALTVFLATWSFAMNLCGPFFAAYMLRRQGLSITWILAFSVLSQLMNILFFPVWGQLAQRFSNKSVLVVAAPVFVLSLLLWPLTSLNSLWVTVVVMTLFHVLAGITGAGIALAANNLTYKTAPKGKATPYMALNVLAQGAASTIAPIIAGVLADRLEYWNIVLSVQSVYKGGDAPVAFGPPPLELHGLDFLFILAFIFGLYALHRLLAVREEGEAPEEEVRAEFLAEVERRMRQVSTLPSIRIFTNVAIASLGRVLGRKEA